MKKYIIFTEQEWKNMSPQRKKIAYAIVFLFFALLIPSLVDIIREAMADKVASGTLEDRTTGVAKEKHAQETKTEANRSFAVEPKAETQSSFAVELSATVQVTDGKMFVDGKTNLPDGTKLMSRLFNKASTAKDQPSINDLFAASDDTVEKGRFSFHTTGFSRNGTRLPVGEYILSVQFHPAGQGETIASIVGKTGEKLTGKAVVDLVPSGRVKAVRFETAVNVR